MTLPVPVERLIVRFIGTALLVSVIAIAVLSYLHRPIPTELNIVVVSALTSLGTMFQSPTKPTPPTATITTAGTVPPTA